MLKQQAKLVARTLYAVDIAITVLSSLLAYWLRSSILVQWELRSLYRLREYYWLLLVIVPIWTVLLHHYGTYHSQRTVSLAAELRQVWKSVLVGGLFLGAIAFGLQSYYLSRTLIIIFIAVNLLLLSIERFVVRKISWIVRKSGYNFRNVIIVGVNEAGQDIVHRIEQYSHWGLRILGFISENTETGSMKVIGAYPVLGKLADLERIIKERVVDEVIFTVSGKRLDELEDTFLMLEDHGIKARVVANMFPHVIAKLSLEELENVPLLTFSTTPTNDLALVVKRIGDVVVAAALFIISLPTMLTTVALIKATSPGPVLFKQKRSGLHGRVFTLYKFRSMYIDAEAKREELEALNEMVGPVFKITDDPRITPVGRFIRKSSIDELPQLWNVLRGDMSIVGPRPPIPEEVAKYKRWQRRRLSMRPGLTCLWQVSGRNKISSFDEWAKLDLRYIDTWSLGLDLRIFLKTIPVVLFRKGAV